MFSYPVPTKLPTILLDIWHKSLGTYFILLLLGVREPFLIFDWPLLNVDSANCLFVELKLQRVWICKKPTALTPAITPILLDVFYYFSIIYWIKNCSIQYLGLKIRIYLAGHWQDVIKCSKFQYVQSFEYIFGKFQTLLETKSLFKVFS